MKNEKDQHNFRMKYAFGIITSIALFTLFSCGGAKQDTAQTQQVPAVQPVQEQTTPASAEPVQAVEPSTVAQPVIEQPAVAQSQPEVRLNPPHGQPYHRCDIPVGAPLPSTTAAATQPATNNQVQATTIRPSASAPASGSPVIPTVENANRAQSTQTPIATSANTGSKPRLNPAHGQPYHRCDIPVGSPLP